jgi:hypothetical protein
MTESVRNSLVKLGYLNYNQNNSKNINNFKRSIELSKHLHYNNIKYFYNSLTSEELIKLVQI